MPSSERSSMPSSEPSLKASSKTSYQRKAIDDQTSQKGGQPVWSLKSKPIDNDWDEMICQLANYKAKHMDCLGPSRYKSKLKLNKVR
jgi:hypothetical protein